MKQGRRWGQTLESCPLNPITTDHTHQTAFQTLGSPDTNPHGVRCSHWQKAFGLPSMSWCSGLDLQYHRSLPSRGDSRKKTGIQGHTRLHSKFKLSLEYTDPTGVRREGREEREGGRLASELTHIHAAGFYLFIYFFAVFGSSVWDKWLICIHGYPRTHYVDLEGLKLLRVCLCPPPKCWD